MNEIMGSPEAESEKIPTVEEVEAVFRELGGEYIEHRRREDIKGLYLLEGTVPGESENEVIGYEYMRAGRYPEGEASDTAIHKVYYQAEGPVGGELAASYVDEKWKILK